MALRPGILPDLSVEFSNPRRVPACVGVGLLNTLGRTERRHHLHARVIAWDSLLGQSGVLHPFYPVPTPAAFRSVHAELSRRRAALSAKRVLVGFDGFVDTLVTPVGLRRGPGEDFVSVSTIADFGERILAAAGKSTNLEFYPRLEKLGGNGPIMAQALLAAGTRVSYAGALGSPVHPVFQELAANATVFSLCAPAHTTAVEFTDGKLMLGTMRSLDEITYEQICAVMNASVLAHIVAEADLVALVNWTMIPHMTTIFREFVGTLLPTLPPRDRVFFFDLADPEKRSQADLRQALSAISRFSNFGRAVLGLNLKEAQQVCRTLALAPGGEDEAALRQMSTDIRRELGLATVVIHRKDSAACATASGAWWLPSSYTSRPLLSTGAGDHFNAGFCLGLLGGMPPQACLGLGVAVSGFYVRTGRSASLSELDGFLAGLGEAQPEAAASTATGGSL